MELTRNQRNNLHALLALALNTHYMNIKITKVDTNDDTYMFNFIRKVSINHLQKIKSYFNVDIRDKSINYSLIVNQNTNTIKLKIEGIENQQVSLFDNTDELLEKLNDYNSKITNRLVKYSKWLYETLYPTDTEVKDWTFYYIANNKTHIGFANADLQCEQSVKIFTSNFYWFKDEVFPSFYNTVDKYTGTRNDAEVICMRRNYNSKHGSDWNICVYGTPITELWID